MIKVKLGKNSYSFPEQWHELKPKEYLQLCKHLFAYSSGKLAIDELRAQWFCDLIGMEFNKKDNENELLWENIYRMSREFRFFLMIVYKVDLSAVPVDLRKKLKKIPPDEISNNDPVMRWVKRQKYTWSIDAIFAKNLLPSIQVGDKKVYGYKFQLSGNLLKTSLTAQQFISATMALDEYNKSQDENHLLLLISILYKKDNPDFFKELDHVSRFAVLLNFQAAMAFIMRKTKYTIIWYRSKGSGKKTKNKYAVGASDSLYSLAKLGFGSIEELEDINLLSYLDLLLKNINDSVLALHEYEVSIPDIAERTGLSIEIVTQIIES